MKTMLMNSSVIPVSLEERRARRPIGRDLDAYQDFLRGYEQIALWADELGFDAFGSTEHHLQIEGGESIPNNLLLYAKLAALTSQIMFVPASVVVTARDPLRVAEDLALFSHMYPGRVGVAFARGFQTRWLYTFSQSETVAANNPHSDAINREKFDEYLSIIEQAWTQDSFNHNGRFYQVPYPASGIPHWPLADWTRTYGAPGDVDEDGTVHKVGIVPKPLEIPPIFIPSTRSDQTIIDSARHGRTLMIAAGGRERVRYVAETYRDAAREAGRDVRLGQNIGVVNKVVLGDTFEEAFELATRTSGFWYQNFFAHFFINEGYRRDSDPPARPLRLADERALTQRMFDAGQLLCGTPEQVHDQIDRLSEIFVDGNPDWLVWEYWAQSAPADDWFGIQRSQLETFAKQVMPALR